MPDMVERRLNKSHPRIGAPSELSLYKRRHGHAPSRVSATECGPHDQSMVDFVILAAPV